MKLKDELGTFEREGLELDVQENHIVTVYHMYSPQQGQDMMFEMMGGKTAGGEYTRELTALLRGAWRRTAAVIRRISVLSGPGLESDEDVRMSRHLALDVVM